MSTPDLPPPLPFWDQRYAQPDYVFGTEPNDFLRARADVIPPGPVLCLAEGEGRNSVFLAGRGHAVSSVDIAAPGVEKTRRLAASRGVQVNAQVGDLATFDLGVARWSGIVAIFMHLPPDLRADLHRRAVRALAPGGVYLIEVYRPEQIGRGTGGPQQIELLPTLALLEQELAGLRTEHGVELDRVVVEGTGHTGAASVVQYIGRAPA